ncbi:uncharacterized protein CTRU02_215364 [Colletotrichum truncatum]|uniref:Uncharacterized protein n=1 Tax=Colletotrichum truncatum TaxID=5467 RepID=A0ACC3YCZ5_COLTU|nr:uncharacterized protein CTRU02_13320 [Colletotrichum truncatum]KAF6783557.1 hypothetical protein CTRU02_13320 [Colletotrichum truncatum]
MADDILTTPYQTYHRKSYAAIDPTQPALSTKSKSAVVTGAGSGIGASIAVSLAKSAISYIALIGRREHALQKTKLAIEAVSTSTKVYVYTLDITDPTATNEALNAFAEKCASGKIDILVANAGSLGPLSSIRDANPTEWWNGFEINIKGNFNLIQAFLPRANTASAIIHISSAAIHGPYFPKESSYCASKIGAAKLFQYVHYEHPEIFVLCLQPGLVGETEMSAGFENIAKGMQIEMADLPWDDADLPADFVVWAVSSEARFLNGRFVWVNWDVNELKDDKDTILANPTKFTLGLIGSSS